MPGRIVWAVGSIIAGSSRLERETRRSSLPYAGMTQVR
jgi:hypothetical protein